MTILELIVCSLLTIYWGRKNNKKPTDIWILGSVFNIVMALILLFLIGLLLMKASCMI